MQNPAGKRPMTHWVDLARVAAMFLIVVIHVSGQVTNVWGRVPLDRWMIADVYGGIARVAVPLFFMLSGYLLLPRSEDLSSFYTRRVLRILIPLAVWSLIYLAWFCGGHPGVCTPGVVQNLLLRQGTYYHLWFLYSLLAIYLILPLLRLMVRAGTDRRLLWYFILLWLIFQPGWTVLQQFWHIYINITPLMATNFMPYFFLGYLLGEISLTRPALLASTALLVLGVGVTILGTYFFTRSAGVYSGFFYDFLSFNVIAASAGAFVLIRWAGQSAVLDSDRLHAATRSLAPATYGIYLVHVLIIEILGYGLPAVPLNTFMGNPLWTIPLVCVVVFGVSYVIVRGLQQVPILRLIVP